LNKSESARSRVRIDVLYPALSAAAILGLTALLAQVPVPPADTQSSAGPAPSHVTVLAQQGQPSLAPTNHGR
jgi:hypothetical protein